MALGATSSQPSQFQISGEEPAVSGLPPSHGRDSRALRPEWPSWMPGTAPCARIKSAMRRKCGMKSSFHRPVSPTVPQPRRSTLVLSMITSPAPPAAKRP